MVKKKVKQVAGESKNSEEVENLKNQIARVLADYQNLERRVAQERLEIEKNANRGLLLRLLPALDTLMLALKHTQDEGLKLSVRQIFDTLEKEGLKKIETENTEFNPETMEAVHVVEVDPSTNSGQKEGKVVEELRSGFILNDKVLRPAQVSVGQNIKN